MSSPTLLDMAAELITPYLPSLAHLSIGCLFHILTLSYITVTIGDILQRDSPTIYRAVFCVRPGRIALLDKMFGYLVLGFFVCTILLHIPANFLGFSFVITVFMTFCGFTVLELAIWAAVAKQKVWLGVLREGLSLLLEGMDRNPPIMRATAVPDEAPPPYGAL